MVVLVAEDNARMRALMIRLLFDRIPGTHTVHEAADGAEAVEIYERYHPDWVLMDIDMKPVDGLTASRRILRSHPDARIIIVSNYDDAVFRSAARGMGTMAFISKSHLNDVTLILSQQPV